MRVYQPNLSPEHTHNHSQEMSDVSEFILTGEKVTYAGVSHTQPFSSQVSYSFVLHILAYAFAEEHIFFKRKKIII